MFKSKKKKKAINQNMTDDKPSTLFYLDASVST